MPVKTKICGISTFDAADAVIGGGADYLGFIFFEKSPRHLTTEQAKVLAAHIGDRIETVAVTVNADDVYLEKIVKAAKPDYLQLHGSESPQRVSELKARYGLPTIKALAIRDAGDFNKAIEYGEVSDLLLFDAKPPKGSDLPGGNGISFDWGLLPKHTRGMNYMLSGGLSLDNLEDALGQSGATMLDISSGVERSPGVKDCDKISALLAWVKDLNSKQTLSASG